MIKNIFLPQSIKKYYLFPTRILGFEVGKTTVKATKLYAKGTEITVEKCYESPIHAATGDDLPTRTAAAIAIILEQAKEYDVIVSAMPSSQVIFKELKLPFLGIETIQKVIGYEVEPLLPFSLQEAVIDCIITKEIPEQKSSEVLIAAAQNHFIAQHVSFFELAGVHTQKITIDLFALYGLYSLIPAYAQQKGGVVLLEIEQQSTHMAYLYDGQLRFIRTLPKGFFDQALVVANRLNISEHDALEHIIRFGLEPNHDDTFIGIIKEVFTTFFNDIIFTLQSFALQAKPAQSINKIILVGTGALIKGLPQLVTDLSHIKTEIFSLNSLWAPNSTIKTKTTLTPANIVSFATALPLSSTHYFDLRKKEFLLSDSKTFLYQCITAAILLTLILGSLVGTVIWQTSKLKRVAYQAEQEAVETLKEHIKNIPEDTTTLDEALELAKNKVMQEEKVWSAFSATARPRFLEYLLELTSTIDKANLGLDLEKLIITPETIILRAKVNGWDELHALEKNLRESKLFNFVESVGDPNFIANGMLIRIGKKSTARGRA